MDTRNISITVLLFLLIGVPRLFTLDAHWASDETLWLARSAGFMNAVETRSFEQTHRAYHPGVTTMWLGGLRMLFQNTERWLSLANLARARWFICVAVSTGGVVCFFLLRSLLGTWPAAAAWSFFAMNPFFLAQTRKVHTDALATLFILLTVLLLLQYCLRDREKKRPSRSLILAGIAFGLACLSKSYSLILLPWIPFCLWIFRTQKTRWREWLYNTCVTGIFFLSWSLLTVFVVWPLFWHPIALVLGGCLLGTTHLGQRAIETGRHVRASVSAAALLLIVCTCYVCRNVWLVFERVGGAVITPHEIDHFFLGEIVADPGWLFYLFTLSIKSTPLVLPLAIGSVFFLSKYRDTARNKHFKIALALMGAVIIFTICLSVTSKKFSRYLLPAFPMLDILAGLGLFYVVKWVGAALKTLPLGKKIAQTGCIAFVLLFTGVPVFALHPYYGTYYNLCWKITDITEIITINDTSGLNIAAAYLNKKQNPQEISVQASYLGAEFLRYYFFGTVYRLEENRSEDTDMRRANYEVIHIRDSQIGRVPEKGWRDGKLEHTITLNGIEYVWIYRVPSGISEK